MISHFAQELVDLGIAYSKAWRELQAVEQEVKERGLSLDTEWSRISPEGQKLWGKRGRVFAKMTDARTALLKYLEES